MLFLSNIITGNRTPYKVEAVDNHLRDKQDSSHHQHFDDEMFDPENLAKAEKKLKDKQINATALQALEKEFTTLEGDWSVAHAIKHVEEQDYERTQQQDGDILGEEAYLCEVCVVSEPDGRFLGLVEKAELKRLAIKNPEANLRSILPEVTLCSDDTTELLKIIPTFIQKNLKAIPVLDSEHRVKGLLVEESFTRTLLKVMYQSGILDIDL